jgi:hypothetical protein
MAQASGSGGPQTDGSVKQAPNDFTIFKKSIIHAPTCVGCGLSSINEPSAANSGTHVVETSNWDLAYSNNGGATFLHLNPYAFSSGFCCDQQVVYNADRDVFILLQLDFAGEGNANNGLAPSVARGTTPTSWCTTSSPGQSAAVRLTRRTSRRSRSRTIALKHDNARTGQKIAIPGRRHAAQSGPPRARGGRQPLRQVAVVVYRDALRKCLAISPLDLILSLRALGSAEHLG